MATKKFKLTVASPIGIWTPHSHHLRDFCGAFAQSLHSVYPALSSSSDAWFHYMVASAHYVRLKRPPRSIVHQLFDDPEKLGPWSYVRDYGVKFVRKNANRSSDVVSIDTLFIRPPNDLTINLGSMMCLLHDKRRDSRLHYLRFLLQMINQLGSLESLFGERAPECILNDTRGNLVVTTRALLQECRVKRKKSDSKDSPLRFHGKNIFEVADQAVAALYECVTKEHFSLDEIPSASFASYHGDLLAITGVILETCQYAEAA